MLSLLAQSSAAAEQTPALIASLMAIWGSVWPYLVMLGGFSVIIFVHELGHFMVAKWAGVRVDRFAVGFGRELLGFTRGETRYSFNILPLGGYVKMLGQEDFDDKSEELKFNDDPRSFVNKPVGHRMAIVSAGVVMNILLACFLFMIVFLIGKKELAPRIATVEPDSPAQIAGLLPGDQIESINGTRVLTFDQVTMAILLAPPHEPLEFIVKRGDEFAPPILVSPESRMPESTRDTNRLMAGIGPGFTREITGLAPDIDKDEPGMPRVGDLLAEVDGIAVTNKNINQLRRMIAYSKNPIIVERKDPENPDAAPTRAQVTIPPLLAIERSELTKRDSVSVLGLTPLVRFNAIDREGRAALAGLDVGDTVLAWGDQSFPNSDDIGRAIRDNPERDIFFQVRKSDGTTQKGFVRPKRNRKGAGTVMALLKPTKDQSDDEPRVSFTQVRPHGVAERAGIADGDLIISVGPTQNPSAAKMSKLIREGVGQPLRLALRRPDGTMYRAVVEPQPPGAINARHTMIAEDLLIVGDVVSTINGKPSPASTAGIPTGAQIVAIGETTVATWTNLVDAFREAAGTSVDLTYQEARGERRTVPFTVPHSLRTLLGVGPEATIVSIDGNKTVELHVKQKTQEVAVGYHFGTRQMLTGLVGQEQVPVEFRRHPLAELETKYLDITRNMVDPWLARIVFQPNVALMPEMTLVKGKNALDAVWIGIHQTHYFILQVYETLNRMIFSRSVGVENISGPLGIVSIGGKVARMGLVDTFFFMAIISANLAVINFLPLPIVDGGLMVFLIIEKIKGSPVSIRVQVATQMIGIALLIGAFLFVTYQDVLRIYG